MAKNDNNRIFLGLTKPPLFTATAWMLDQYASEKPNSIGLDMSQVLIVVPTARAQHRLLQLLVVAAEEKQLDMLPPQITTIGQFPEHLYTANQPLASELDQQIAWAKAIENTPADELHQLTGRPVNDSFRDWQALAHLISKLHSRLANDIWSFTSVAREVTGISGFLQQESARWTVLAAIQKRYYQILENVGLWDKQAARNYAAAGLLKANEIRCQTDKQIVMLATADLNRSNSEMLRQIGATNPSGVHILIAAEKTMADRFDPFGSLVTEKWLDAPIKIPDSQIRIADRPADQAQATVHFLTHLDGDFSADEITIGVPDETLAPQLERCLNALELPHRYLAGKPLSDTSPVLLLDACRDYLHSYSYDAYAALVRHPDLYRWLIKSVSPDKAHDFLGDLAVYQNTNLPGAIRIDTVQPFGDPESIAGRIDPDDPASEKRAGKNAEKTEILNRVHEQIASLLEPLDREIRPIAEWAEPWSHVLLEVFGSRLLNPDQFADRQIIIACESIQSALTDQQNVPAAFETKTTATEALDWALQAAAENRVVTPPIPDAIELAGWLDLPLDDAPVMVVTGMNDENVPSSESGHHFIPNELCKKLGILDNDRRFARDCYALHVISSVREKLLLIIGRRDGGGESLKPSRLLFADDTEIAVRRAKAFFSYPGNSETDFWLYPVDRCHPEQQFQVPRPICTRPVTQISVTKFRDFIKCPYRFYLNHVLRLDTVADDVRELDGGLFGDLAHNCLEAFGKSDLKETSDKNRIYEFLNDQLNTIANEEWSGSRLPAVRIQVEKLRLRFKCFAEHQSVRRKAGWQIVSTEEMLEHDFVVDGEAFNIRGKIDRVDRHEITGQIAVWDYKSSDKGELPEKVHYASRKQEWKDLQLPLYRHLVREVDAVAGADFENAIMGYVLLPKDLSKVGFHEAHWTAEQLAHADDTAKVIIRQIRELKFWPRNPVPPPFSEIFASICQDHVFEKN